jgi:two-component system, chemotaxis family, protein-glutamate methylesterase/glutaminase
MASAMRVLLAPMPVGLRLQLRRLLRDLSGVEVVGQLLEGGTPAALVQETAAQAVVLDASHTSDAFLQSCLASSSITRCVLLHDTARCAVGAQLADARLKRLQRPPTLDDEPVQGAFARQLQQLLGAQPAPSGVAMPAAVTASASAPAATVQAGSHGIDVLAIGSSTGGPQALQVLFAGLAASGCALSFPIVVTQHMAAGFVAPLAQSLQANTGIPTHEAHDGMQVLSGHAYLAPGGRHLRLETQGALLVCRLDDGPPENFCKPAVDVMLRSLSQVRRLRTLVVILTGMGQDGLLGCQTLQAAGATILAQDKASSVVWGMPGAVAQAGICHAVLPLEQLAERVMKIAEKP